ncbi:uncharacterized protein TNCV_233331 [Trichonephila clavipes]|nr:uncharacterized protein TNCV_233331 [Trichonephila clavipes]
MSSRLGATEGCGSPVVKISDHGRHVMSSSLVPLKTRRVGERCTLNLSRAQTSSHWCSVVVRREWFQLRCRLCHLTMIKITWSVAKSSCVVEQCDVNIPSLTLVSLKTRCVKGLMHAKSVEAQMS